jgi:phosphoribosylaminoimidazolecarboxamide formyltransferase/IMP cyclohydrolase
MKVAVRRALLSVSDKSGLVDFARRLDRAGVEIVSSGGTAAELQAAGVAVTPVSEVTGAPEMLGGRVKTLHPRIHAGILARADDPEHLRQLSEQGIEPFQLVVVNLYPFRQTAARIGVSEADVIEQIDIGGPALVRAAAKNYHSVAVVTTPDRYQEVAAQVEAGGTELELRRELAGEAFFHTSAYDAAVVGWWHRDHPLPRRAVLAMERWQSLRYGENPHQEAAAYQLAGDAVPFRVLQGKEMSFNNFLDLEAARRLAFDLEGTGAVIVKHTNPCGVAVDPDLATAFTKAWECDPLSAFGGVVAVNRRLDLATAGAIVAAGFVEVVSAPAVTAEAAAGLAARRDLRLVESPPPTLAGWDLRRIEGGLLAQQWDRAAAGEWASMTDRPLQPAEEADLRLAWTVAAHTKSNAVVVVRELMAVGVGAGDQSRVGAAERALARAGDRAEGAVAASDAFFPFPDGIETLARAGVVAVVAPGGSKRDQEVVAAAADLGISLVFTDRRHFRH